jgi:hypothetical protein
MEGNRKHIFPIKQKEKQSMGLLCFFHRNPVSVKKAQHGKNGFGFAVYGLPGEERWLGREGMAKRRAPSA